MNIFIDASNQEIDYGNLSPTPSGYVLNLQFLRDYKDSLPSITNISDGGSKQTIEGEDCIIWDSPLIGNTVNFTFDNYDGFNGVVTVHLV